MTEACVSVRCRRKYGQELDHDGPTQDTVVSLSGVSNCPHLSVQRYMLYGITHKKTRKNSHMHDLLNYFSKLRVVSTITGRVRAPSDAFDRKSIDEIYLPEAALDQFGGKIRP